MPQNFYAMRLERPTPDWKNFKKIMRKNKIRTTIALSVKEMNEGIDVFKATFMTNASREELLHIMIYEGSDLHVAYQTLQPFMEYTGERDFTINEHQ
jgi:hypothetical protein